MAATALLLVGAIRAWDDFDADDVMTYLYTEGPVAGDIALLLLYRTVTRRNRVARGAL